MTRRRPIRRLRTFLRHEERIGERIIRNKLSMRARNARVSYVVVGGLIFVLPVVVGLWNRIDFTAYANEPLAYYFFFSARILAGDPSAWLWHSQILTAAQNLIVFGINAVDPRFGIGLRDRLNIFSVATHGVTTVAFLLILGIAARDRNLRWADRFVVLLAGTFPVLAFGAYGLTFLWPAYYSVDLVVCSMAALLYFHLFRQEETSPTWPLVWAVGVFLGLAASNKIFVAILAIPMIMQICLHMKASLKVRALRLAVIGASSAATIFLVVLASNVGNWHRTFQFFPRFLTAASGAGGEAMFWEQFRTSYLRESFPTIIGFVAGIVSLGVVAFAKSQHPSRSRARSMWIDLCVAGLMLGLALYLRPAHTTLLEVGSMGLALGGVALSLSLFRSRVIPAVAAALVAVLVIPNAKVYWDTSASSERTSRVRADDRWAFFRLTMEFSGGRHMIVFLPDNSYHNEGVYELMIKGSSAFPTWEPSEWGRRTLAKYLRLPESRLPEFRTEQGGPKPSLPIPGNVTVVWYERSDFRPLTSRYPNLGEAVARPGTRCTDWEMAGTGSLFTGHVCNVGEPTAGSPPN